MSDVLNRLRSFVIVFYEYAADDGALLKEAADELERLQARVRELEAALGTARTALIHTRAFATLRSLQIQMDEALLHIAAVSAEKEDDGGK